MANKKLFKSLIGKLMPATAALNEEQAPAYKLSPEHLLAQYAATGCLNRTFYASADDQLHMKMPANAGGSTWSLAGSNPVRLLPRRGSLQSCRRHFYKDCGDEC